MFYQDGLALAVSSFQVKHIIVKERVRKLIDDNGVSHYQYVDAFFVDSILYYFGSPIHRVNRFNIAPSDIEKYKEEIQKKSVSSLLNSITIPPIHHCYGILAAYKAKEKIRGLFFD